MKEWKEPKYNVFNDLNLKDLLNKRGILNIEEENINLFDQLKKEIKKNKTRYIYESIIKGVKRIIYAIDNNENITVFGDYDVDGICSTSIIVQFLRNLKKCLNNKIKVSYDIPDRLLEGYGLNMNSIKKMIKYKTKLLITVDCGTLSFDEINYANNNGIDVIVIDHHKAEIDILPNALTIINPFCYNEKSCFTELCAAGLSFMFIMYLYEYLHEIKNIKLDISNLLDLVTFATIADMVPILEINRLFIKLGIKQIKKKKRIGILTLCNKLNINIEYITEKEIGFGIAPCINAIGRLGNAKDGILLLLSYDFLKLDKLSEKIIQMNEKRKKLEYNIVLEAKNMIIKNNTYLDPIIVIYNKEWHPGVIGIASSRLVEIFYKPVIIIGNNGKGSGRSIKDINLYEKIKDISKHKEIRKTKLKFGGHSLAIGLSLDIDFAFYFKNILCEKKDFNIYKNIYIPDFIINPKDNILKIKKNVRKYYPFGQKNNEPIFIMYKLKVIEKNFFGNNKEHLKIIIKNNNEQKFNAIKFRYDENLLKFIQENVNVDIIFTIDKIFKDNIQLLIIDIRISDL